ncbi:MAG: hypothetical protein EHM33_00685 [Chloroflexi bacterium]|nr:MAG: hypothetical protein EHM33_00685 [Chloroflexota bacterium]
MAYQTHNTLVKCIHDHELRISAAHYLKGRLIDIGCGAKPCKKLLSPYVTEHGSRGTFIGTANVALSICLKSPDSKSPKSKHSLAFGLRLVNYLYTTFIG